MTRISIDREQRQLTKEWLEPDGLGGFASGTVGLVRTRRYHALLLAATKPPAGRVVLWNGFDASLVTDSGTYAISTQRYAPDVFHPDGEARLIRFESDPWPKFTFALPDAQLVQEIFVLHGSPCVIVSWRLESDLPNAQLIVRPFLSGRNFHALHHENISFDFRHSTVNGEITFQPYSSVPKINFLTTGDYHHQPEWYRNFEYSEEAARGLDHLEDLASPGTFVLDVRKEAALIAYADDADPRKSNGRWERPAETLDRLRIDERARRDKLGGTLGRAASAYVVARGGGRTIVAGYPWFADWGRDTFIAIRGLCIAQGRLDHALQILRAWAPFVSRGILPNRFPDDGGEPEYNSVDAALWFVIAVGHLFDAYWKKGSSIPPGDTTKFRQAIEDILSGYAQGTHHGIRLDSDGLIAAGQPGLQLTWMDAKVGNWVVTPRIGKPVEIQALWLNALRIARYFSRRWDESLALGLESFNAKFWCASGEYLYDVVDEDHRPGQVDSSFRPNQIFAAGGLPLNLLDPVRCRKVVDAVEQQLWTPLGLRTLAPADPRYAPTYSGDQVKRDAAYHQGTAWPWLIGPFVEAWVKTRGKTPAAKEEARQKFLGPLLAHLSDAGIDHISEIADGDAPHTPRGCPFQAWSVGELLRLEQDVLAP